MRTLHAAVLAATPAVMGTALVLGFGSTPVEQPVEPASATWTVDGHDYPQCAMEDCSDVPRQVGVWIDPDTGDHWFSTGPERSVRVDRALEPGEYTKGTNPLDVMAPTRVTTDDESGFTWWREHIHGEWIEGCGVDLQLNDDAGCAD